MRRDLFLLVGVAAVLGAGACGGQNSATFETKPDASRSSFDADDASTKPGPVDQAGTNPSVCGDGPAGTSEPCAKGLSCEIASTPCGGDVVGTWNVMNGLLRLTGQVDLTAFGLGCTFGTTISGSLEVSGTWIADALGNVWDNTTTKGVHTFTLAASCREVLVVNRCDTIASPLKRGLGYATVECVDEPETGGCACTGTIEQQGGLAAISSSPLRTGRYAAAGTSLTTADGVNETTYERCVMDDTMVLTLPTPSKVGLVAGSIVLQKVDTGSIPCR